jgi:hypothetical protein
VREARNPPAQDPTSENSEENHFDPFADEDAVPLADHDDVAAAKVTSLKELLMEFLERYVLPR